MILINKNANNTIDLTLAEKSTLALPYYLFVLKNDISKQYVRFIAINSSVYRQRYDRFLITETSGTNIYTSGVITLNPTGYWHYKIYEQSSLSNLDENLSTGLVEEGKALVVGTTTTHAAHSTTRTYKAYGKGAT
jgi:hypothetical protein